MDYAVDPDITVASTIDSAFYRDQDAFELARERIFARTWQWIGDLGEVAGPGSLSPRVLLPGMLDEPLLLARDGSGELRCLSNVCTHRGNILVRESRTKVDQIRCGYHSRRFDLSGRMTFMPEFAEARNFPAPSDDLPRIPFGAWADHGFAAIDPAAPLEAFLSDTKKRLAWLPLERFRLDPASSRTTPLPRTGRCTSRIIWRDCASRSCIRLEQARDCAAYEHELFAIRTCSSRWPRRARSRSIFRRARRTTAAGLQRTTGGSSRT